MDHRIYPLHEVNGEESVSQHVSASPLIDGDHPKSVQVDELHSTYIDGAGVGEHVKPAGKAGLTAQHSVPK